MGSWDGLVRRHVRFTFRVLSIDIHLRGIPAVCVGLVSLGLLILTCQVAAQQLGFVSQTCDGDWGCIATTTLHSFTEDIWTTLIVLGAVVYFALWVAGIGEMQGPFLIVPLAPGVVFNEADIVRRVQTLLQSEGLDPVPSDTIVRAVSEIRARGGALGLYRTRNLGVDPKQFQSQLVDIFARLPIKAIATLNPRQREIVISEIVEYVRETRTRGINAYPWNRTSEVG
jgi:hypothetical protein